MIWSSPGADGDGPYPLLDMAMRRPSLALHLHWNGAGGGQFVYGVPRDTQPEASIANNRHEKLKISSASNHYSARLLPFSRNNVSFVPFGETVCSTSGRLFLDRRPLDRCTDCIPRGGYGLAGIFADARVTGRVSAPPCGHVHMEVVRSLK